MNIRPTDFTSQENIIADCLSEMGIRFEHQKQFGNYTVDFWIADLKFVIEADGVYGHLKKRDVKRDTELMELIEVEYIFHIRADTKKRIKDELWRALKNC